MENAEKQKQVNDLKPVDWPALTPHYRAGIRSLRSLGAEFGVTPAAIIKHCRKRGVARDLKARIVALAQEKVNAAAVNDAVNRNSASREPAIVDDHSNMVAAILIGHRKLSARARRLTQTLLAELEAVTERPDLFVRVSVLLAQDDEPTAAQRQDLRDVVTLVSSLPQRVKVMRDLAEVLHRVVSTEREACGLNTAAAAEGRPLVILKDYTGR